MLKIEMSDTLKLKLCSQMPGRERDQKRFEISVTPSYSDSGSSSLIQSQYTQTLSGGCFFKCINPRKIEKIYKETGKYNLIKK